MVARLEGWGNVWEYISSASVTQVHFRSAATPPLPVSYCHPTGTWQIPKDTITVLPSGNQYSSSKRDNESRMSSPVRCNAHYVEFIPTAITVCTVDLGGNSQSLHWEVLFVSKKKISHAYFDEFRESASWISLIKSIADAYSMRLRKSWISWKGCCLLI